MSPDWQVQATTEIGSRLRFKVKNKLVFERIRAGRMKQERTVLERSARLNLDPGRGDLGDEGDRGC